MRQELGQAYVEVTRSTVPTTSVTSAPFLF